MRPLLIHNEELERYSFGKRHPMGPDRVRFTMELAAHLGLLQMFEIVEPPPASDALLRLVHTPEYIAALHSGHPAPEFGIGIRCASPPERVAPPSPISVSNPYGSAVIKS